MGGCLVEKVEDEKVEDEEVEDEEVEDEKVEEVNLEVLRKEAGPRRSLGENGGTGTPLGAGQRRCSSNC